MRMLPILNALNVLTCASLVVGAYSGRVHKAAPERAVARLRQTLSAITALSYPGSTTVHIVGPFYSTPGLAFLHTGLGLNRLDVRFLDCSPPGLRVHRGVSATQGLPKRRVLQLRKSFEGIRQRLLGNCMAIFISFLIGCLLGNRQIRSVARLVQTLPSTRRANMKSTSNSIYGPMSILRRYSQRTTATIPR